MPTKIEWCDETINPIQDKIKGKSGRGYHCTKISPGCLNCYAETINNRFGNHLPFDDRKAEFELVRTELWKPIRWKKPRNIFVQSMGDLFHSAIRVRDIDAIWSTMSKCSWHTFLILSKRPQAMADFVSDIGVFNYGVLPNLYLGITVCTQQEADEKIPVFLQIPGKKFLSIEPMLAPINFGKFDLNPLYAFGSAGASGVDWWVDGVDAVILGGETGSKARPMHPDWVRLVRDQCQAAGVPFFFKQWGEWYPVCNLYSEDKDDLTDGRGGLFALELSGFFEEQYQPSPNAWLMDRVGKKAAGRILDGRTHDDLPWLKGYKQTGK